jgi:hypothetical protein
MKIAVVFLMGKVNHVEITTYQPRVIGGGSNVLQILKEGRPKLVGGRGIDIDNLNIQVRGMEEEANCDHVISIRGINKREESRVPSSKNTTSRTGGREMVEGVEAPRQEHV